MRLLYNFTLLLHSTKRAGGALCAYILTFATLYFAEKVWVILYTSNTSTSWDSATNDHILL